MLVNGSETETEETGLQAKQLGNGGNSALFDLKDEAMLYVFINL